MTIYNRLYDIRAEYPGGKYEDFQVVAEDLEVARHRAEKSLMVEHGVLKFDWQGLVVFVKPNLDAMLQDKKALEQGGYPF